MAISDQIVVITGAGAGIGRALAIGFARDGARVIGFGRTESALIDTATHCPNGMVCVVGDVSAEADVERLVVKVLTDFGRIDVLINNAAIYPRKGLLNEPASEWLNTIVVNLFGPALCCQKVLPHMFTRGYGRIINIGSFAGNAPLPTASAYSVSKAGVMSLTKAVAAEIDRAKYPNVLINELVPGAIRTSMSDKGEEPESVYPHAKHLVELPGGGPCGRLFIKSELFGESTGIKGKAKKLVKKMLGKK